MSLNQVKPEKLRASYPYEPRGWAKDATCEGRDLRDEIAAQLDKQIQDANHTLSQLRA